MKAKISAFFLVLLTPLWTCSIFKLFSLGSIGPIVLIGSLINALLMPLILILISREIGNPRHKKIAIISSMPIGIILAYLQFISYMPLVDYFGLDDFDWL